jgi:hypothetical protein
MSLRDAPETWSDEFIAHGLAETARTLQWKQDQHQDVDVIHSIARALAAERDRRRVLSRFSDELDAWSLGFRPAT